MGETERVPEVYFQLGNLRWDHNFMKNAYINEGNWKEKIEKAYPEFSELSKSDNFDKDLKLFLIEAYRKNFNKIADSIIKYQKVWDKVNEPFMKAVSEVIETSFTKDMMIMANVGINPISPRSWRNWNFCISFGREDKIIEVTAHETLHFFYFKKLIEEFPQIDKNTFDSPHPEWLLSEILAPIILQDPRIIKVIGETNFGTYACDNETLPKFNELYKKHLEEKTSFIDFYKDAKKMML